MATSLKSIAPEDIQNELNRLWESLESTSTTRACLFNLIFYTQKNHRTDYINRIAQKVVEKFPSRVIFVSIDKDAKEDFLKTQVSILTSSQGEIDVACDYIDLEAGGPSQVKIPFVVMPHILPDLPVYVVWAEDPSKNDPLSYQFEQLAQRVIFDSESTDNLPRFASAVLQHREKSHCAIADLNWGRIESWRDMLSQAFYAEERLEQIKRAKTIAITYNAQESAFFCHTKIQAIYLQAWLACQLEWEFKTLRIEKDTIVFSYEGPEITISATNHKNLPPGIVLSVAITTAKEEHFTLERNLEMLQQITMQHSTPQICELPTRYLFPKAESGQSLVKEICHRGTSEHYVKVLNLVKKMDVLGLC